MGCGDSSSDFQNGFEANFDRSFHESLVASCVAGTKRSGASEELATNLCTCASDKVKQRFTVQEKMNLKNEQIDPIIKECLAQFVG